MFYYVQPCIFQNVRLKIMKRVYALYRVSTKRQVDKDKDSNENDIPMQKQACHRFAEQNGWEVEYTVADF